MAALVRLLSSVAPDMAFQVVLGCERPAAVATQVQIVLRKDMGRCRRAVWQRTRALPAREAPKMFRYDALWMRRT